MTTPTATVSTHVLDSALGRPAAGIAVLLTGPGGTKLDEGATDADGRIRFEQTLGAGVYRLTFATAPWFAGADRTTFYPEVVIAFQVADDEHHHVALLLGPFAYTTYRGS